VLELVGSLDVLGEAIFSGSTYGGGASLIDGFERRDLGVGAVFEYGSGANGCTRPVMDMVRREL
jgi:hypothetical protein